jgi:dipeptidyl aminopeptidase/acylaminoacyl peptidase
MSSTSSRIAAGARAAALLVLAAGCGGQETAPGELVFLRGALLAPAGAGGRPVGGGRELVSRQWRPGERVELRGRGGGAAVGTAPQVPDCVPLFSVDLGDIARFIALGGEAPDTALAFSPDGGTLAVGSYRGEIVVADAWTGAERARRRLAETMVKQVAWSPDGRTLYAAEQSPDAYVHALDPASLRPRWSRRLADEVGSSAPPEGEDLYGVYTLPSALDLAVLPDGDLLVGATHAWSEEGGAGGGGRLNRARLLRLAADGTTRAAWPQSGAVDALIYRFRTDLEGGLVAASVGRSADGPAPDGVPVGGVQILRLTDLAPLAALRPEPLLPYFQQTFVWESLDVDGARGMATMALADGRVQGWGLDGTMRWARDLGTPVLASEVPIAASIGFLHMVGDTVIAQSSGTNIPYGSASTEARPPSAHPGENTLWALDAATGTERWRWTGPWRMNGLVLSPDGRTAAVATSPRAADAREDLFGALLFELAGEPPQPALCSTESPTFFRPALQDDGRVAVAEHPFLRADGTVVGAYRVTVLR